MQRRIGIILILIILTGAFLRIYQLGKEGLTLDEILTAEKSANALPHLIKYWFSQDHFPTYFIFLHYWMQLFGKSEIALRFPSAVCGIIAIYFMFLLGKRLFNEKTGLLVSCIFTLSIVNIFHSQWARPYSAAVLFTLLSFLSLLEALGKRDRFKWLRYMLLTLMALLLSISTFPILPCQIIFVILLWQKNRGYIAIKQAIAIFCFILVIYLPLLLFVVINPVLRTNLNSSNALNFYSLTSIFNHFGGKIYYIKSCGFIIKNNSFVGLLTNAFGISLFLLFLIGLINLIKVNKGTVAYSNGGEYAARILLPLWLVLPFLVILPAAFAYSNDPFAGSVRYLLYVSCPYYLLVGKGIVSLKKNMRILLCILIIIMSPVFLYRYYHFEKWTNWRKVCAYIKNNLKEDEKVAFIMNNFRPVSFIEHIMLLHYSVPSIIGIKSDKPPVVMPKKELANYIKEINLIEGYATEELRCRGIWMVTCIPSHPEVIERLNDKYNLIEEKEVDGVSIYRFRIKYE